MIDDPRSQDRRIAMTRPCGRALIAAACGLLLLLPSGGPAQEPADAPDAPRLVVVLVVDQLRADYLARFREHFGPAGFNRFFERGAEFPAARYAHAVTKTCAGHAVVLTGSHADANGIIGNEWYDPVGRRDVYCARDDDAPLVGVDGEGRSPRNLRVSTVGDELRLATAGRSRVVSVAGKDRSAIMLGGHLADGAYWLEDTLVTTSTYYRDELPDWVGEFNASGAVTRHFGTHWRRALPESAYAALGPDDVAAENDGRASGRTFPHPIGVDDGLAHSDVLEDWRHSPFPNEVVIDLARRAVVEEGLGTDDVPDLLGIGLSANDWVGHWFGPSSHEVLDVTVRTDRLLEAFFDFLDREVGMERVLVVLTADHGVASLPEAVEALSPGPATYRVHPSVVRDAVTTALDAEYGAAGDAGWILDHGAPYLYLDGRTLAERGIAVAEAERVAADALMDLDAVHAAYTHSQLRHLRDTGATTAVVRSFDPARSGNIFYSPRPNVLIDGARTGTTHGSPWSYDTRVPLLWLGPGVRPGTYHAAAHVADIAPTLAALLGIMDPPAARGRVLDEILTREPVRGTASAAPRPDADGSPR